jgi:tetratricopeptide (TPR) repeat protein
MHVARAARRCLQAAVLVAASAVLDAQQLPDIDIAHFPEVSRQAIGPALADARAHPSDAAKVGRLAMLLHAREQFDTAAAVYARARTLERRFDWFYLGGLVETRRAHHAQAAQLLREAVRLRPDSVPGHLALADALFESGDLDGASQQYAPLGTGTGAPHAHYGLGRCLAAQGDNMAALRELDAAVAAFPEFGAAWYTRGMVLRNLGRTDEARTSLEKAQRFGAAWPTVDDPVLARVRAMQDDAPSMVERGQKLQRQGDVIGAIREYEAALARSPALVAAHVNLIALYGQRQEWARAESHYQAVLREGPAPAEAHVNYGSCLAAQGNVDAARDAFRKALAVNPHSASAWRALGQLAEAAGQIDDAEAAYRKAAADAPADPAIRLNIGRMLIARQRYSDAITELQPLAGADFKDRPRLVFALATAFVLNGDVASGRRYAVEARDLARASGQDDLAAAIERDLEKLPR